MHMQSTTINPAPRFPVSQIVARTTMSSSEIAELTGKKHKNVIRDIREMLIGIYGDEYLDKVMPEQYRNRHSEYIRENANSIMEALFGDGVNRSHQDPRGFSWERDTRGYLSCFQLDKEHALTLVSGYNVKLRKRIVDRWAELESRTIGTIAVPSSLPEALRLAADLADQIAEQAPKVAALERLQGAAGTLCLTDAAKHLGIPRHRLMTWLQQNRWMYRRAGTRPWIAYQPRIESGLVVNKVSVIGRTDEGDERCASQFRITAKGLSLLAQKIEGGLL